MSRDEAEIMCLYVSVDTYSSSRVIITMNYFAKFSWTNDWSIVAVIKYVVGVHWKMAALFMCPDSLLCHGYPTG